MADTQPSRQTPAGSSRRPSRKAKVGHVGQAGIERQAKSEQSSVFLSYSHRDEDRVIPIASYLGRIGLKVWMDVQRMPAGTPIIQAVSEAVQKADLFVICMSPDAMASGWVQHELDAALTFEIARGWPKILPLLIAPTEIPPKLASRSYLDVTESLDQAKPQLKRSITTYLGSELDRDVDTSREPQEVTISSVRLRLSSETNKSYGGLEHEHTKGEVEEEASNRLKGLHRKANGILLNFIAPSDMNFSATYFRFPNGNITERIQDVGGDLVGTIKKRSIVEVEVLNPKENKLSDLISSRLDSLGVSRVTYSFALSPPITGLPQRTLQRLQDKYVILGWDLQEGADVEMPGDLRLCVRTTEESITIGLETKYDFQFETRAKEFSVREFVDELLKPD